jgi:hypothetical protein
MKAEDANLRLLAIATKLEINRVLTYYQNGGSNHAE